MGINVGPYVALSWSEASDSKPFNQFHTKIKSISLEVAQQVIGCFRKLNISTYSTTIWEISCKISNISKVMSKYVRCYYSGHVCHMKWVNTLLNSSVHVLLISAIPKPNQSKFD